MKRILCILFGCGYDDDGYCPRCREHIYEGFHYVEHGKLERVVWWCQTQWWRAKWFVWMRRCSVCGKRLGPGRCKLGDHFCSRECMVESLPF